MNLNDLVVIQSDITRDKFHDQSQLLDRVTLAFKPGNTLGQTDKLIFHTKKGIT